MKHLIDSMDLSIGELEELFTLSKEIMKDEDKYRLSCEKKLMSTLFYEPSTRTRFSFEAAMLRLGGKVIGFSEASSSSASKGESLPDTIRTVGSYVDLIVMRHPKEGAPRYASLTSDVPIINAGDGGHQHPTQTLTDLLTIIEIKGKIENQTIGICGDLKFGRTVHSLIKSLSKYEGIHFILISPPELKIPEYIKKEILLKEAIPFIEVETLEEVMADIDVLYMTRVQKERFFNEADYVRLKDTYILDNKKLISAKKDLAILHPLPRMNEISPEVDSDPRAVYFKQAKYGMYVRMALIIKMLGAI
ncbi:aspartate carbamoyltransferase [Carnobacterium sp. TMP28]|uniref:aspartate carbamoyltransferase n=1 Tax=Carnobacterium sp. TMP28 TaxID=3397060 RepID=UPI0039E115D8